jgi:hypothetical protein
MRYEILIKKGRNVVGRYKFEDYTNAMRVMDAIEVLIEETAAANYTVEFKDL